MAHRGDDMTPTPRPRVRYYTPANPETDDRYELAGSVAVLLMWAALFYGMLVLTPHG